MINSRQKGARAKETWVSVYGFPKYEVNQYGEIRHKERKKILKYWVGTGGYCYIGLLDNEGKRHSKRVHVLVLMSFHPVNKKEWFDTQFTVNHIDGNKQNNCLSNLEWCSLGDNLKHAFRLGLVNITWNKKVICLDNNKIFDSVTEATLFAGGKKAWAISRVCQGKRSQYRNKHFAYYEDYINNTIPSFKGKAKRSSEKLWQ